jgi:hypothetical protein
MSLIDNHHWVRSKIRLHHKLSQQHTISHVLDYCILRGVVLKTNRITDLLSKFHLHLLTDSWCYTHCSHSSWLSTAYLSLLSESIFMEKLRKLGCFTRACLSHHNNNLVVLYQRHQFFSIFKDGERLFYKLHWCFSNFYLLLFLLFFWFLAITTAALLLAVLRYCDLPLFYFINDVIFNKLHWIADEKIVVLFAS